MSIERARIIKGSASFGHHPTAENAGHERLARRIPAAVVEARAEAARIVSEASIAAEAMLVEARAAVAAIAANAASEAREQELARLAADFVALRFDEEARAERELDRTLEIAVLLAERLVGEAIAVEPSRVAAIARGALQETRGARRVRIEACPADVAALGALLGSLAEGVAHVEPSEDLPRGSLVVHTELGRVDARLAPQLARLAGALRETLRAERATRDDVTTGGDRSPRR